MAKKVLCDFDHDRTLELAEYKIRVDGVDESYNETDVCTEHFGTLLEAYKAGGIKPGTRYGIERVTDNG